MTVKDGDLYCYLLHLSRSIVNFMGYLLSRLETRTKEFNIYASLGVTNSEAE